MFTFITQYESTILQPFFIYDNDPTSGICVLSKQINDKRSITNTLF